MAALTPAASVLLLPVVCVAVTAQRYHIATMAFNLPVLRLLALAFSSALLFPALPAHAGPLRTIHISRNITAPWRSPAVAIGGALDGLDRGAVTGVYTPRNIAAMKSAGLGAVTYRLRTELGIEAWHWNPSGTWSDAQNHQGYWTSAAASSSPLLVSNGYRLPRRGSTGDQANNDSYSRIDDGDPHTFWKSNPYLDRRFAGDNHPQWVFVDLGEPRPVNTIRIQWAAPFATAYAVQYWQPEHGADWGGIDETVYQPGRWMTFPRGTVSNGRGGDDALALARAAIRCRCVRVWMTRTSGDSIIPAYPQTDGYRVPDSGDVRARIGYAIREISVGITDGAGNFHDFVRHTRSANTQTVTYASSTDPWHCSTDRDRGIEQPGFDRVTQSGLTRGLPVLYPVGVVYDTPENAVNEVTWLMRHRANIRGIELGEEPDGQYMTPEDYAALYLQFAAAIHAVWPGVKVGGPSYQTVSAENPAWADAAGDRSFTRRFINYLKKRERLRDLGFFSFECYPFDDVCGPPAPHLRALPGVLAAARKRWIADGVPADIPWYITELGFSPYAGKPEVEISGAIADAEIVAQFLAIGGDAAFFYGYEPNTLIRERPECPTWGNLALFQTDDDYAALKPFAAERVMELATKRWAKAGPIQVSAAVVTDAKGRSANDVSAYAACHKDGSWSLLVFNKCDRGAELAVVRLPQSKIARCWLYGPGQYQWQPHTDHGHASPNLPPVELRLKAGQSLTMLALSVAVVEYATP